MDEGLKQFKIEMQAIREELERIKELLNDEQARLVALEVSRGS